MSLRLRLLLLAAFAVLPALVVEGLNAWELHRSLDAELRGLAKRQAQLAADELARTIDGAQLLLAAMAEARVIRESDAVACRAYVLRIMERAPQFALFGAAHRDGQVFCNQPSADLPKVSLADRPYFQRVVETGRPAIGEFTISRPNKRRILPVAAPLRGEDGTVAGVVVTAVDLDQFAARLVEKGFSNRASLTIADRNGTILVRLPNADMIGEKMPENVRSALEGDRTRVVESDALDGVSRIFAAIPGAASPVPGIFVGVGIERQAGFAVLDGTTRRALAIMFAVLLAALGTAWLLGERFLRQPIAELLAATARWRAGDYSARTAACDERGEIGSLGAAFNALAETVAAREATLRAEQQRLDAVLRQMPSGLFIAEAPSGRIVGHNARALQILRHPLIEADDVPAYARYGGIHGDGRAYASDEYPTARALHGETVLEEEVIYRCGDGTIARLSVSAQPVRDDAGEIIAALCVFTDVTQRQQAEEALRESEQRLQLALKAGRLGSWSFDLATAELTASATCKANFGRGEHEPFTYEMLLASVHPDDRKRMEDAVRRTIESGADYDIEYRNLWPDGSLHWVLVRAQLVADERGPRRLIGVSTEITERKRAELTLRDSEERLRAALVASGTGTFRWNIVTNALEWDEALDRLFGLVPGETARSLEQFVALVHPEDRAGVVERCRRCADESADFYMEFRVVWPDGTVRWLLDQGKTFTDDAGRSLYMTGACVDITERKLAEDALARSRDELERMVEARTAALEESQARYRTLFDSSFQLIGVLLPDGTVVEGNRTSLEVIGARPSEIIGKKFWETPWWTATPGAAERLRAGIAEAAGGKFVRYEAALKLPGTGTRFFDFSLKPVRSESGEVILIIPEARDITERKQAEEQLLQAQKMEAIGQLTGGVAHDFNNLLTAIQGNLELALAGASSERLERQLGNALRSVERAAALTQRLLVFSRREERQVGAVDLPALAGGMDELLSRSLGPLVRIRKAIAPELWPVRVDANQLEMVLLNLAINARDAMALGGTIVIGAANEIVSETRTGDPQLAPGEYVRIWVADTGSGMDEATRVRVFEPFFTTKGVGKGTGLGLAMVQGISIQSGGGVAIRSRLGEGTTVEVWLPRADGQLPARRAAPSGRHIVVAPRDAAVLLVDDDTDVRAVAMACLEEAGYAVFEAESAAQALTMLDAGIAPDLMIADVAMPEMNGVALAAAARLRRPALAVLLASGYAESAGIAGAEGYEMLPKPFRASELTARVAELIGHASPNVVPFAAGRRPD